MRTRSKEVCNVHSKIVLPRRTFLRGMGARWRCRFSTRWCRRSCAQSKGAPRFAAVYVGNGVTMDQWTPAEEGIGFALSPTLKAIEPLP